MVSQVLEKVLDAALWAASGDNAQPWRIDIQSENSCCVGVSREDHNVYNLLPMPDWVSLGMFIENASLQANALGYNLECECLEEGQVELRLMECEEKVHSPLLDSVETRSVNRFPYKNEPLIKANKDVLEAVLDDDIHIHWFDQADEKRAITRLMMKTTSMRLRMQETYEIHRDMIEWDAVDSEDKMPISSIGLSKLSSLSMKWVLKSAKRNAMMMKIPGATKPTELELDVFPGLKCAAHFVLAFDPKKIQKPSFADYIHAGRNMQRFWLQMTTDKLVMQPWYIVLMFSLYQKRNIDFTAFEEDAAHLYQRFTEDVLEPKSISLDHVFFTGRIGEATKLSPHRSIRKPLKAFIERTS